MGFEKASFEVRAELRRLFCTRLMTRGDCLTSDGFIMLNNYHLQILMDATQEYFICYNWQQKKQTLE